MPTPDESTNTILDHLPAECLEEALRTVRREAILDAAPFDLDHEGMYADGYLFLTADRFGHFVCHDEHWQGEWLPVSQLRQAAIIEGLGMNLLRVSGGKGPVIEFRFTLRHAKAVARLQRQLERNLSTDAAKDPDFGEAFDPNEKKLRCEKCGRAIPPWSEVCPACMNRRKILFRLLDFVKPHKYNAIGGFILALALTAVPLVRTWLIKPLTNDGLGGGPTHQVSFHLVVVYVALFAGLLLVSMLGQIVQLRLSLVLGTHVSRALRNAVYAHMHRLSLSFFAKHQTGSLVTRVTNDTERVWYFISGMFIDLIVSFLLLVGVGVMLFIMNWRLAAFALLPVPVMFFFMVFFHNRLHRSFSRMWDAWAQLTAVVGDALPGVRVIKAFSQEKYEVDRFENSSTAIFDVEVGYISGVRSLFAPTMAFASTLGTLVVWLLGGWWLVEGKTDLGTLFAFQGFLAMFLGPIHQIAHMDEMLNRAATSAARIFDILDTQPTIYSKTGAHRPDKVDGRIELQNVSFTYDGIRKVLKNIDLAIEPGQMIGLAGPSGGGKTTLINLISRFYDPLEGRILIDGVDLRDYDLTSLRRKIGVVLQEPFLFHGTIAENIAYGNPSATLDQILIASRAANAHDFIVGFPDGYDTLVGERGQTLSGGERQRISIARAILNNPSILILDEATSSVDTETEKLIQEALDRLIANRTTIAIAHRLSTLRKADRLVIMEKGNMIEEGTHEELAVKADGLYARLLRMQRDSQSMIGLAVE